MNSTILNMALALLLTSGREALKRALTPPEAWVRNSCARTGADPTLAIEERDEAAELFTAFIEGMAGVSGASEVRVALGLPTQARMDLAREGQGKTLAGELSLLQLAVWLYQAFGRGFAVRALTPPASVVNAICAKTGADPAEAIAARNRAAAEMVDFIESLVDPHFIDTDEEDEG